MRKTIAILSIFAASMVASAATAQAPEGTSPLADATAAPASLGSKLVAGVDAVLQNPLDSGLRRRTDFGLGGLVRFEYILIPRLNLTARVGYIYAMQKASTDDGNKIKRAVDNIPVWVGGKYFVTNSIYGAAELGLNMLTDSKETSKPGENSEIEKKTESTGKYAFGMNVGAGVLVKAIDIRAQLGFLEIPKGSMALLVTAGFNILPW
jgi:hypothetical protein